MPAGLFLWAGLAKAFDRQASILAVDAYQLLPDALVRPVASVLPWVEIAVAALLLAGLFVRTAGIATALLASMFIVALAQAKARGLAIDCGCFGGGGPGDGVSWWDIVRDVPVVLMGIYLAAWPNGPWQLDNRYLDLEDIDDGDDARDEAPDEAGTPALRG